MDTYSNKAGQGAELTAEKINQLVKDFAKRLPPVQGTAFDLFGSDRISQAYEINPPQDLRPWGSGNRRLLFIPKNDVSRWASELVKLGADVRIRDLLGELK
jgi:hypothetical protein